MRRRRRGIDPMHDDHVNVTPLIDVVMCLIIFFLACSHMTKAESNDRVIIPRADLGQELPEVRGRLLINLVPAERMSDTGGGGSSAAIDPRNPPRIFVRTHEVHLSELALYLRNEKKENPDLRVILRADEGLAYQWISPVLVACVQANIGSVNFSTRK